MKTVMEAEAEVGSASGTTASELRLVETMATQAVRGGQQVSPEVKAELKKLIDESLAASKEQIKTSHTADITAGNTVVTNYNNNCLSPFDVSQAAFVTNLAPTGATGLKHSSHKSCREQWRIDDHDRKTKCDALEAFLSGVRSSAPAALTVPTSRSSMAEWWVKIKAFAAQYDTWKSLNDACIAAEGVEDATLADCNTKQGGFERAVCSANEAVNSGCEAYEDCYAVSSGDLAAQKIDGQAGEASRKVEWEAIAKIECFVNLLLNENGETDAEGKDVLKDADLQACKDLTTDTSFLDLIGVFPVLPDEKVCITSALDAYGGTPCQDNFLETSYEGLSDTNLATCVACKGKASDDLVNLLGFPVSCSQGWAAGDGGGGGERRIGWYDSASLCIEAVLAEPLCNGANGVTYTDKPGRARECYCEWNENSAHGDFWRTCLLDSPVSVR